MLQFHGDNFKIIIVEPNLQVYADCTASHLTSDKNISIYAGLTPSELYSDLELIHFLLKKPTIIAHPASFNLYQDYFKKVLTFEAPEKITDVMGFVGNIEVKKYLSRFNLDSTFEEVLYTQIPSKPLFDEIDFLAMALVEMTKRSHEKNLYLEDI